MPKNRLRTIDDTVLAAAILEMRDDYGFWDQDPMLYKGKNREDHQALGGKLAKGVSEALRRVEKEGGIEAHQPLKRIFAAASKLDTDGRASAHAVFDALRAVPRPKEPPRKYAF